MPDSEDWSPVRDFLERIQSTLRDGDVKAGVSVLYRVLPLLQRAVSSSEKVRVPAHRCLQERTIVMNCMLFRQVLNLENHAKISEAISESFVVDEESKQDVIKLTRKVKTKVKALRVKVKLFAKMLDAVLDDAITRGVEPSWAVTLKVAFQMNRSLSRDTLLVSSLRSQCQLFMFSHFSGRLP